MMMMSKQAHILLVLSVDAEQCSVPNDNTPPTARFPPKRTLPAFRRFFSPNRQYPLSLSGLSIVLSPFDCMSRQ